MKIIDRYIGQSVIGASLTVLLVLLAIFSFFSFIEELEDLGRGSYDLGTIALVVLLSLPGLAYSLFPMAALIGSLLGLGALMERSEIAVVRGAGVSKLRIIWSVMKTGIVFVLIAMLLGELLFPAAEHKAHELRAKAIEDRTATTSEHGFWARDGHSYINIGEILPGKEFRDISIFEFDADKQLRSTTHAQSAHYADGRWVLTGLGQTEFPDSGIVARRLDRAAWNSVLDPDIISTVTIRPETLSLVALSRYVAFSRRNGQNSQRWEHALWAKLGYPLATAVMVFLAIPLVFGGSRSVTTGRRILIGALIGLGFHVVNQAAGHLGVVFGVPAPVSALGPTLVLLALAIVLNYRTR